MWCVSTAFERCAAGRACSFVAASGQFPYLRALWELTGQSILLCSRRAERRAISQNWCNGGPK
eukprot:5067226-Lingulodinium_polyedra.AAC.1